jgi:hypothetical protein
MQFYFHPIAPTVFEQKVQTKEIRRSRSKKNVNLESPPQSQLINRQRGKPGRQDLPAEKKTLSLETFELHLTDMTEIHPQHQ